MVSKPAKLQNCQMLVKFLHVYFRALYIKGDASRETKAWLEILEKITAVRMTIMSLHVVCNFMSAVWQ